MKKIYQAPEVIETTMVVESIVAQSAGMAPGRGEDGEVGEADIKRQDRGDWNNIWNN